MRETIGIYLHIPFCLQKCLYCDFNSYSGILGQQDGYTAALCREIAGFPEGYQADTVYFGGGTPTLLKTENVARILEAIEKKFRLMPGCEITMECNPGTADERKLKDLRRLGVSRLSIGMQSADDRALEQLGRIHRVEETVHCVSAARTAGFDNLSLDLMYGLPGQHLEDWEDTLAKAVLLAPEHLSCYALKVEEGTPFAKMELDLPGDDAVRAMYDLAVCTLGTAGYARYEISNFALPGRESRHNCKYWRCDDFAGVGAGAYSCIKGERYANIADVGRYMQTADQEERIAYREQLSREEQMSEYFFLGLRTAAGVEEEAFARRFGIPPEAVFAEPLKKYRSLGFLQMGDGRICLAEDMFFVCNSILADFLL